MSVRVVRLKICVTPLIANCCVRHFLHAFTGQPLPTDEDLMKDRSDEIPEQAKEKMRELGIDPENWQY